MTASSFDVAPARARAPNAPILASGPARSQGLAGLVLALASGSDDGAEAPGGWFRFCAVAWKALLRAEAAPASIRRCIASILSASVSFISGLLFTTPRLA